MSTVIVSGAAGFIGSHLCDRLLADGYGVVGIDDLSAPVRWWSPGLVQMHGDVREQTTWSRAMVAAGEQCSRGVVGVFHLACPTSVAQFTADPVKTITTCVIGVRFACLVAEAARCPLIAMSSCEAYGHVEPPNVEGAEGPLYSDSPRAGYEQGKRALETIVHAYRGRGLRAVAVRLFQTYGPRMGTDGRMMPAFITHALRGEPIPIYGDGQQIQAPCYVADVVDALIEMWKGLKATELRSMPLYVNLGSDVGGPVETLARTVWLTLRDDTPACQHHPARAAEAPGRRPDLTLLRALVPEWSSRVPLVEGIRRTAQFYRAHRWEDRWVSA